MTRRCYEVNTEALAVIHGAGQAAYFNLTAITRTGIDFTDSQGPPEMAPDLCTRLLSQLNVSRSVAAEWFGHKSGADDLRKQHY